MEVLSYFDRKHAQNAKERGDQLCSSDTLNSVRQQSQMAKKEGKKKEQRKRKRKRKKKRENERIKKKKKRKQEGERGREKNEEGS